VRVEDRDIEDPLSTALGLLRVKRQEAILGTKRGGGSVPTPSRLYVLTEISRDLPAARQEIFASVLSLFAFEGDEQAFELANDSDYDLAATVWKSLRRRVEEPPAPARRLRCCAA
jgi:acyl-CoA reductase-like NAD-dependent aldehyde dehydrogenase